MSISKRVAPSALSMKIITNLTLAVLMISVCALCLAPVEKNITTQGERVEIYRSAGEKGTGVSVMFNVYSDTQSVYKILDILEEHQAKATFFIGGCWADDNVECLKIIAKNGHEIGNHGYFHKDHTKLDLIQNQKEITQCNTFIELALGKKTTIFAPPSGAYDEEVLTACKMLGMKTILWSKDTIDWRDQDETLIYKRATQSVKKGDFVLMHPTPSTAKALDDILKFYKQNSLQTVTVLENLQENS